jgi:hypothetical protein
MGNLIWVDSAQHLDTTGVRVASSKYTTSNGNVDVVGTVTRGNHDQAIQFGTAEALQRDVTAQATYTVGGYFYFTSVSVAATPLIRLCDKATHLVGADTGQICVVVETDGTVSVRRSSKTGTQLDNGGTVLPNTWHSFEITATIDNAAGAFELRIDGSTVASDSGVDTQDTANAYINSVCLGRPGAIFLYMCDVYIHDDTFMGPMKSEDLYSDGAGNYTQWTPSAGSNWQNVDERPPDEDTTYNLEATATQKDSFTFQNTTQTGTVKCVAVNIQMRMDDAGPHTVRPFVRISSTDYFGTAFSVTGAYVNSQYIWEVSPATAVAWTDGEIDGAEFGVELVS